MRPSEPRQGVGISTRELAELAICTALLFVLQIALAALPNIEVVSLLVVLYTQWYGSKALLILYAFAVLEGFFYGFHLWWIPYLYVWTVLWLAVTLLDRRPRPPLFWAMVSGIYGLMFGLLCSFPTLFTGGVRAAFLWWIAGIPFDFIHGAGNFGAAMILYWPLERLYRYLHP